MKMNLLTDDDGISITAAPVMNDEEAFVELFLSSLLVCSLVIMLI